MSRRGEREHALLYLVVGNDFFQSSNLLNHVNYKPNLIFIPLEFIKLFCLGGLGLSLRKLK